MRWKWTPLLLILAGLAFGQPTQVAHTVIATATRSSNAITHTAIDLSGCTSGAPCLLACQESLFDADASVTAPTVTGAGTVSWSLCGTNHFSSASHDGGAIWYAQNVTGGTSSAVFSITKANDFPALFCVAYHGVVTTSACALTSGTGTTSTNACAPGSITPGNNDLVVTGASYANAATISGPAGYTTRDSVATASFQAGGVADNVSDGTATNPSWGWSTTLNKSCDAASFTAASSGGTSVVRRRWYGQ